MAMQTSPNHRTGFSSMFRFLFPCTFLILFVDLAVFGQDVSEGRNSSLSRSNSDSPWPVAVSGSCQSSATAAPDSESDDLAQASCHVLRGELDAAIQAYKAVLQKNPKSPEAYAGLTLTYARQKNLEQAYETATAGLKVTDAPAVHVALGEVYYRQGKITEAEKEWMSVINKGTPSARAYWGLSQARAARSLYQQAKEMLDKAHELDPQDPDISRRWIRSLSRTKQIQFWENYLAAGTKNDNEARAAVQHRLDYLRAVQSQPQHSCRPVGHISAAEMKLARLSKHGNARGYGLEASLNGKKGTLLLDTGGTGILIGDEWARQAGITKISEAEFGGIGDQGVGIGYSGFANSIKIGEIEFQGCRVRVIEKGSLSSVGITGIIGADMFSAFLVDIDFPNQKVRLEPLPKRPQENAADVTIETGTEGPASNDGQSSAEKAAADVTPSQPARRGPRDRYIAPEMQSYTQVFRFEHLLLVPTRIGDSAARLFALDTGGTTSLLDIRSSPNLMSMLPPQESTHLRNHHFLGMSGSFPVYNADNVILQFGRLRPKNQNVFNCDLSHVSDQVGTEISGILGFDALHLLEIRIDYRDGLVDFIEKP
jgi:tetratricopeptide (TPR) repeat protein